MPAPLLRRSLPRIAGDHGGLPIGRVTRVDPLHVFYDVREYGPVICTLLAAARRFEVGDQVLVSPSDVDNDRLIVIDGIA